MLITYKQKKYHMLNAFFHNKNIRFPNDFFFLLQLQILIMMIRCLKLKF